MNIDPAFEQKIVQALAGTINPNNEERKAAELSLGEARHTPGYASALLKISADVSYKGKFQLDMNHAASIQFGQLVEIHWKFKTAEQAQRLATSGFDFILLNEADKQCVRDNIMDAVLAQVQNKPIQKQFIRSLKMICIHDYPEKLPNLFPQCLAFLQKNEQLAVYAGLQGLFALAARYEFELDEDREPLHKIIQESFSVLGTLVNDMINNKENVDALYMLHLICKVFYVSNQLQMSPYLMEGNNLQPWIQFLKTIMDMPCPPELSAPATLTEEIVKRDKSIFWKIKGIAAKITYRIFVKYGNPATVEEKVAIQTFSSNFALNFSIPLLESHLQLMFERKDKFVGSKALSFCIKFTSAATKQENTMDKLKPFVENILYDTVIPIMFITEKDMSTFANDPVEYIRNLYDFTETLFQPKNTVQDLLVYLCRYSSQKKQKKKGKSKRGKPDYLHPFLAFAVKNLTEYNSKITSGEGADFRIKEAILYAIGTLKDEIWGEKDLKSQMEQMLLNFVLPELDSIQPFMRQRACQTYGVYCDIKFKEEGHLPKVIEGIFKNMQEDQPLPVKFHAACALEKILSRSEAAQNIIKPGLDLTLQCFLKLMNELDNEEVVAAFENVMASFQDNIGPFSVQICEHLRDQYIRLIKNDADDDDGESILAAVASFTSIRRVLDAIQEDLNLLSQVEAIIYPCLLHSLTADGLDSIEEGIDCITMIVHYGYKTRSISPTIWKLYPQLLYICAGADGDDEGGFGFEFVSQIAVTLKNYISRDPEGMLAVGEGQDKNYLHLTYHFLKRCLEVNRNSGGAYIDGVSIMSLMVAIFENMQGRIDADIPTLLGFILAELEFLGSVQAKALKFKSMILQALAMCFSYNAGLTFSILESSGKTLLVFQEWFKFMNNFSKDFEYRRNIFGLCAIVKTPENQIPQIVNQKIPEIMNQISLLAKKMHTDRIEVIKENEEALAEEDDGAVTDSDDELGDDIGNEATDQIEDDVPDSDEEWKEQQKVYAKLAPKLNTGKALTKEEIDEFKLEQDSDDDDSDYDFAGGDDSIYDSRLDDYDELKVLKESLEAVSQSNPALFQRAFSGITDPQQKQQFEEILNGVEGLIAKEKALRTQITDKAKADSEKA